MKLLAEIQKDGKSFFRETRTVTLLFIMPLLILLVLGGIFGKPIDEKASKVVIALCDLDNTSSSALFVDTLRNNSILNDLSNESECIDMAKQSVKEGKAVASVIIPQGFEKGITHGRTQTVDISVDNSRIQIAQTIETLFKAGVQSSNQDIGLQFITSVWERLKEADGKLDKLLEDLGSSRNKANEIKEKTDRTAASLNAIDISVVTNELELANETIDETVTTLNSANDNITIMRAKIDAYDNDLIGIESSLSNVSGMLANISNGVKNMSKTLNCGNTSNVTSENPGCGTVRAINSTVESAKSEVNLRLSKISATRQDLRDANLTLTAFQNNIDAALNSSDDAHERIERIRNFTDLIEKNRNDALETIKEINTTIIQLIDKTYELEGIIKGAKKQIGEITSKDPAFVISPILLKSQKFFSATTFFDFLLPSLIPLILMFVSLFLSSTSIVKESYYGMLERIEMSQVSSSGYVIKKVVSYTVVLLPEAILLLLTASLAFNAFDIFDFSMLTFLLVTCTLVLFVFNALGMLISLFTDSEATAFLASLVIGLPFLFMSGILFPFEFMPSFVASIGQLMPLTPAINAMQSAIIYKAPDFAAQVGLLTYAILFTSFAIVAKGRRG